MTLALVFALYFGLTLLAHGGDRYLELRLSLLGSVVVIAVAGVV